MLPFFFRHYQPLVDHFFIHDNDSSDRSREICQQHGNVTVLPLVLEGDSLCQAAFEKVNQLWHVSRGQADWVAVCNIDEFFWHPDMLWYLEKCRKRGVSFVPSEGYEMVSETFPREEMNLAREIRFGTRHARILEAGRSALVIPAWLREVEKDGHFLGQKGVAVPNQIPSSPWMLDGFHTPMIRFQSE